jgi:HSP20 family protein
MTETNAISTKETSEVAGAEATRGGIYYAPRVDIFENAEELVLLADMPGIKPQDLDVRFEKGELSVFGKVQPRHKVGQCFLDEYGVGDFYRSFAISPDVDSSKITAEYREGVLTVHLPKQEKLKPKRIAVKTS